MTTYVKWARSEAEAAQMQYDGWLVDLHQPMTHHHIWAMLLYWPHMNREPPTRAPDQNGFHGTHA